MKSKITIFFLLFLLLVSSSLVYVLYINNNELSRQLESRDILIKDSQQKDSLNCEHTEKYVNTITKYITNDCGIIIDEKEVTLDQFIEIYTSEVNRANSMEDSFRVAKYQLEYLSKYYSIKIDTKLEGNNRYNNYESKRLDSALMLLSVFKDRLSYDSISKQWSIKR